MWADRRRKLILTILGAVAATIVALTLVATVYQAPSCTDHKQDQGEAGVDCGGPCSKLCTANLPTIRFAYAVSPQPGRSDVIAEIDNTNQNAALLGEQYTITLYGVDASSTPAMLAQESGSIDLAPSSTYPLFIPNFYDGNAPVRDAFLSLATTSLNWQTYIDTRPKLSVGDPLYTNSSMPRITSVIGNPTAYSLCGLPVVVTVSDASNNVIAASESVLQEIPAMGSTNAVFTWPVPFREDPAGAVVTPLLPLTESLRCP